MELDKILELEAKEAIEKLCRDKKEDDKLYDTWLKEFTGDHKILDQTLRPDKKVPIYQTDEEGNIKYDAFNQPLVSTYKTVTVARLPVNYQEEIVTAAVYFLFGKPVKMKINNEDAEQFQEAFEIIEDIWKDNKLRGLNKDIATKLFSETKVAELWYLRPKKNNKPVEEDSMSSNEGEGWEVKVKVLSESTGDKIYTHYDAYGDLDAVTRKYKTEDDEGKPVDNVDVYTANVLYRYSKSEKATKWELVVTKHALSTQKAEYSQYSKIPLVVYTQLKPEWAKVQHLIEHMEHMLSSHADAVSYFSNPILKIKGSATALPDKDDGAKIIQIEPDMKGDKLEYGDVDFLVWKDSPEGWKNLFEKIDYFIRSFTKTPDMSIDAMKEIPELSGKAFKFVFMGAMLKAHNKQEIFEPAFQRRNNILKAILAKMNRSLGDKFDEIDIGYEFGNVLPDDIMETISALAESRPGKNLITARTAAKQHPFVDDPEVEVEELEKDEESNMGVLGESFDV